MRGWWRWALPLGMMTTAMCSTVVTAQAAPGTDVCSLATDVEFQKAQGINPAIGIIPTDPPVLTEMVWGPHCDYSPGSIDLFTKKSPEAELERVLTLTEGGKTRVPVQGLGQRAFFTTFYPDDKYRRRGLLAISLATGSSRSAWIPMATSRSRRPGRSWRAWRRRFCRACHPEPFASLRVNSAKGTIPSMAPFRLTSLGVRVARGR